MLPETVTLDPWSLKVAGFSLVWEILSMSPFCWVELPLCCALVTKGHVTDSVSTILLVLAHCLWKSCNEPGQICWMRTSRQIYEAIVECSKVTVAACQPIARHSGPDEPYILKARMSTIASHQFQSDLPCNDRVPIHHSSDAVHPGSIGFSRFSSLLLLSQSEILFLKSSHHTVSMHN